MSNKKKVYAEPDEYGWVEWLRAHRIGLAPLYLGLPVLALGIVANVLLSGSQVAIGVAAILLGAITWITKVSQGWRKGYFACITFAALVWICWTSTIGTLDGWRWSLVALASGAIVAAIPHWMDRVKRTQVRMEQTIRDWPIRAARIGLGLANMRDVRPNDIGWTGKLVWADGEYMVDNVIKQEMAIEAASGLPSGTLKVSRDGKSNSSVILNVTLEDPHEKGILWEIPTKEVNGGRQLLTLHGSDQIHIGVRTDGTKKFLQVFKPGWGARQILIAGIKGSGKSGLLNRLWAHFAMCDDVVQWGIDLKGGVELGPWRGTFDWIVDEYDKALLMIESLEAIVDRRARLMKQYSQTGQTWKNWRASPEHPWLVLSIDEAASLLGKMNSAQLVRMSEICRKGRAVGVAVIMATQYPTLDALGSSQIRQQIDQRFCFRMADNEGEGYVLASDEIVNAHKIDDERPGTCYHEDAGKLDRLQMRIVFVPDGTGDGRDLIADLVGVLYGKTPTLDRDSIEGWTVEEIEDQISAIEAYANRETFSPEDRDSERDENENETTETARPIREWTENADVSLVSLVSRSESEMTQEQRDEMKRERDSENATENATEKARLSEEDAVTALVVALRDAGAEGASVSELEVAATRKKTWVYDRLTAMEEQGQVRRSKTSPTFISTALVDAGADL